MVLCGAILKGSFQVHHKDKSLGSFDSFVFVSYGVGTDRLFIQEPYPPTGQILFKDLNSLSVTLADCSSSSCFQCR